MNKEAVYPWIFAIIGGIIGLITSAITPPYSNYIMLNTIVFGITFGCIYGWIIKESRMAITIGGVVGGLFGLHPVPLVCFVFMGAYDALEHCYVEVSLGEASKVNDNKYYLFGAIVGAIMAFLFFYPELEAGPLIALTIIGAILGMILHANFFYFCILPIAFGIWVISNGVEIEDYWSWIASPLFVIPLLAFIGYGTGKIAEKRAEEKEKFAVYKSKIEQWKREGYDVSELEEMLK